MESIGEQLKRAREEQHLSIEQAARGTHISKHHLEALENEQFDAIPGETYRLGFLRSYANFLKLPPDMLINRYKNLLIQEQQSPMQELLESRPRSNVPVLRIVLIVLGLVLLVGGVFLLYASGTFERIAENRANAAERNRTARNDANVYDLEDAFLERRFSEGDIIVAPVGDQRLSIRITQIDTQMHLESDIGSIRVGPETNELIDLDGNGSGDIRVLVRSIEQNANPPAVIARFDRVVVSPDAPAFVIPNAPTDSIDIVGSTAIPSRQRAARPIGTVAAGSLFPVEISARVNTMLHYQTDDAARVERFLEEGAIVRLNVDQRVLIWVANVGAISMSVAGQQIGIGEAGQVQTFMVSRGSGVDNQSLQLVPIY